MTTSVDWRLAVTPYSVDRWTNLVGALPSLLLLSPALHNVYSLHIIIPIRSRNGKCGSLVPAGLLGICTTLHKRCHNHNHNEVFV